MESVIDSLINKLRNPKIGLPTLSGLIIVSFLSIFNKEYHFLNDVLRVIAALILGFVIDHIVKDRVIETHRHRERLKVIEEVTGLYKFDLQSILPDRDSKTIGHKDFGFFIRMKDFQPRQEIILIGITNGYLVNEVPDQMKSFLKAHPKLSIIACFLNPDSPCAPLRSLEVFNTDSKTRNNIENAIGGWRSLQACFPGRIILKKLNVNTIPYAEYQAIDVTNEEGIILFTPITYKEHTIRRPVLS